MVDECWIHDAMSVLDGFFIQLFHFSCSLFDVLQDPLMPSHQMLINCLLSLLPSCGEWVKSLSPTIILQLLENTEGMTLIK